MMMELGILKWKMMSWTKFIAYMELVLARGLALIHTVNLSTETSRWVKPLRSFFEGPQKF
jgi:hypothetical protein